MYKGILLCMLINLGLISIASEQKSIYLVELFPLFKSKQLLKATEILLKNGVDPNYRPSIGRLSPLMWAMQNNHQELAWLLYMKGANPYHVITSIPSEQNWSIGTILSIVPSTPWRENAFMMGNDEVKVWLKEYVANCESHQKTIPYIRITHS